jgi:hypothetical protein
LVAAQVLGTCAERRASSSLALSTKINYELRIKNYEKVIRILNCELSKKFFIRNS